MMAFRVIKTALQTLLTDNAGSSFRVIGQQGQSRSAEEVLGNDRSVQVYYSRGEFPLEKNSYTGGPFEHNITLGIDLTVSQVSTMDLSLINSSSATAEQRMLAMAAFQEASYLADTSLDELYDLVWQIIMDNRNYDLGLAKGYAKNRWVSDLAKDEPLDRGKHTILTGRLSFSCLAAEEVTGETPGAVSDDFDVTIDIFGDDTEQTGVAGHLGPYDDDTTLFYDDEVVMYDGTPVTLTP